MTYSLNEIISGLVLRVYTVLSKYEFPRVELTTQQEDFPVGTCSRFPESFLSLNLGLVERELATLSRLSQFKELLNIVILMI